MADISKITPLDGITYNIKDAEARQKIPWAIVDSTSTATAYTIQVPGITKLENGVSFICWNNKITSEANCTLNVNGLGAKPMYLPTAAASRVTTHFSVNYMWLMVYNENRVSGGCWDMMYLFNSNTTYAVFNALTHANAAYLAKSVIYRYQLCFQCDDDYITPLNNNSNATGTAKTMLTNVEFDPFGEIFYYASTATLNKDARATMTYMCWHHGTVDLRYTFNCGSTLTAFEPLYLKVSPQSNGKVKIANTTPWTHSLPSTNDGFWYIFLGRTYSAYQMALYNEHPVYFHDGTSLKYVKDPKFDAYTKTEVDSMIGDIESLLAAI